MFLKSVYILFNFLNLNLFKYISIYRIKDFNLYSSHKSYTIYSLIIKLSVKTLFVY